VSAGASLTRSSNPASRPGNKLRVEDRAAHDWYRFVLSFPPHLVREYITRFRLHPGQIVLDPFCGTGTTLVECKKLGIESVGIEAAPMASFASEVKTNWLVSGIGLMRHAESLAEIARRRLSAQGIEDDAPFPLLGGHPRRSVHLQRLPEAASKLLLTDSISPLPLHKVLVLLDVIEQTRSMQYLDHEKLALAKALVSGISNLEFGPEVGVGPAKADAPVIGRWLQCVQTMAGDLQNGLHQASSVPARIIRADARDVSSVKRNSIDAVFTSPPYPNEKDYTRTTRLESVLLGFVSDRQQLRSIKHDLVRSNTRNVYKGDRDDEGVARNREVLQIATAIERRRRELGKTSGFERLYPRVTKLYFGGMTRHLSSLRPTLKRGALLAYVVGDQASYLRIMIRTGKLLADIASSLGYQVMGLDLFRTRLATATRAQLREEVLLLRWPG
jgi:hypothetical protein